MSAPFANRTQQVGLRSRSTSRKPRLCTSDSVDTLPVETDTRIFVWQRDGGQCRHCGSRRELHFDHVIPRSLGGASTADNVQLLCRLCNQRKGPTLIDGGST
jgi:5-methylcytosine-specific restriction endonuclease McrA